MQLYLCNMIHILFDKADKVRWVRNIASFVNLHCNSTSGEEVVIDFSSEILPHELKPFHLASLACLVQFFVDKNFPVSISRDNKDVCQYVCDTCGFSTYWRLGFRHALSTEKNIFSLWKIKDDEKDIFASEVTKYFKNTIGKDKDYTPISTCLAEAYNNVFDHAQANGNAFSAIYYNKKNGKINVAICDFGISIPSSVRAFLGNEANDKEALEIAIKKNFTVQSQQNNRGFGLDNILTNSDNVRLFSKGACLVKIDGKQHISQTDFNFTGTLIDFDIDTQNLEEEDILTDFDF